MLDGRQTSRSPKSMNEVAEVIAPEVEPEAPVQVEVFDAREAARRMLQPDGQALTDLLEDIIREATADYRQVIKALAARPKRSERGLIEQGKMSAGWARSAQLLRASMAPTKAQEGQPGGYDRWVMAALAQDGSG